MDIRWDVEKYKKNFAFVYGYGEDVIDLLDGGGIKTVLDIGCGNGALTKKLYNKGYKVTGLDCSAEFLEAAAEKYPYIPFIKADAASFVIPEEVDAVFSNAALHWIDKSRQQDVLACVYSALKKGGQFVFEMGGRGNNRIIHGCLAEAFARYGYAYSAPFYFPTVGEYSSLLEKAGFEVVFARLFERPTELCGGDGLKDWINMFVKTPFEAVRGEEERREIINRAAENARGQLYKDGKWYADYVRLRMKALKL